MSKKESKKVQVFASTVAFDNLTQSVVVNTMIRLKYQRQHLLYVILVQCSSDNSLKLQMNYMGWLSVTADLKRLKT